MRTIVFASTIVISGCALLSGCSDLVVGQGQQASPVGPGDAGASGEPHSLPLQVPLSTACDLGAPMPRADRLGECDDDGWCWEEAPSTAAMTHVASQPGAKELWLWSRGSLHHLVDGKWVFHTAPSTFNVTGAVVLAADDIWVTTETLGDPRYSGYLYHFDGLAWTRVGKTAEALNGLRASPDGTLWTRASGVDYDRIEKFDGTVWQLMDERASLGGDYEVRDFRPVSADEAWVLRDTGVEHISAKTWLQIDAPAGTSLTALDLLRDGSVWVAGVEAAQKAVLFQVSSDQLSGRPLPAFPRITALTGSGPDDLWLAAGSRVDHFDGQRLTSTHEWFGRPVHQLVATDASTLFALTYDDLHGQVIRWDGARWDDADRFMPRLSTVWGGANDDVWASGDSGRFHFDGKAWGKISDEGDYGLWGTASDNVYALRHTGALERYDGRRWAQKVAANDWGQRRSFGPDALSGDAPNSVWVAAGGVWHYDGIEISRVSEDVGAVSVHAFTANDVWVATRKDLLHYDGSQWQSLGVLAHRVWGTSSHDLWIVEENPPGMDSGYRLVSHFDGATWTKHRPRVGGYGQDVSALGGCDNFFWISDADRVNLFDGTKWSTILRDGPYVSAIWGRSPSALVTVGDGGLSRRAP